MKKLILFFFIVSWASASYAATQYNSIGSVQMSTSTLSGGLGLFVVTKAQAASLTPTTTGQLIYCSDCTAGANVTGAICVSTASTQSSFVLSTGTVCK